MVNLGLAVVRFANDDLVIRDPVLVSERLLVYTRRMKW